MAYPGCGREAPQLHHPDGTRKPAWPESNGWWNPRSRGAYLRSLYICSAPCSRVLGRPFFAYMHTHPPLPLFLDPTLSHCNYSNDLKSFSALPSFDCFLEQFRPISLYQYPYLHPYILFIWYCDFGTFLAGREKSTRPTHTFLASTSTSQFQVTRSSKSRPGIMCDYTQVEFRCGHVRYTVRAWCTNYETTHKRCPPSVVAIEFR
jgi:hypothetical protein